MWRITTLLDNSWRVEIHHCYVRIRIRLRLKKTNKVLGLRKETACMLKSYTTKLFTLSPIYFILHLSVIGKCLILKKTLQESKLQDRGLLLYCHSPLGGRPGRPHRAGRHTDASHKAPWEDWGCRGVWYQDCSHTEHTNIHNGVRWQLLFEVK